MFAYAYRSVDSFMDKMGLGNGFLTSLKAYWSFESTLTVTAFAEYGGVTFQNNFPTLSSYVNNGLISKGCASSIYGDANSGFYTTTFLPISLNTSHSVSVWMSPATASGVSGGMGTVIRLASSLSDSISIAIDGFNNKIEWGGYANSTATAYTAFVTTSWAANDWIHCVYVYDSTANTIKLYVNSVYSGSVSVSGFTASTTITEIDFMNDFGELPFSRSSLNGRADELGVWQRVLTQADITSLYNSGSGKAFSTFS